MSGFYLRKDVRVLWGVRDVSYSPGAFEIFRTREAAEAEVDRLRFNYPWPEEISLHEVPLGDWKEIDS